MHPFSKYFDHTLLKPDATSQDISNLVKEAAAYDFHSVCVSGCHLPLVSRLLEESSVKTACVVGFPLGASSSEVKCFETENALKDGADEIDMVVNIGMIKDSRFDAAGEEIKRIAEICHTKGVILKTIIETCLLNKEEIEMICRSAEAAGTDFIKTSTGFSTGGAKPEDIRLIRASVSPSVKIKASGGIRTLDDAITMINAGADRLGCSASVSIMEGYLLKNKERLPSSRNAASKDLL